MTGVLDATRLSLVEAPVFAADATRSAVGRSVGVVWLLSLAACDCDYRAHAPGDGGAIGDAPADAGILREDAGEGDGPWVLAPGRIELFEPACAFAEGQRVFVRVTVIGPTLCQEPGPVDVRRAEDGGRELLLTGRTWSPAEPVVCADMNAREDRWVDLGILERGTWRLRSQESRVEMTIEVGAPSGRACADPAAGPGEACETDCDCAGGTCMPDLVGGSCARRCGDLPCGAEPDCLQGRCEPEMPGLRECRPTDGACSDDAGCPPAQRCVDGRCTFRDVEPFTSCTSGRQCAAGWSCVVDESDLEHGVCALRCFTDRTPCGSGTCQGSPGLGPAWTCG